MGNSAQDGVNMAVANKDEGINYGQYLQVREKKKNCKKNRQIEGRSALHSLNVNKLPTFLSFCDFERLSFVTVGQDFDSPNSSIRPSRLSCP